MHSTTARHTRRQQPDLALRAYQQASDYLVFPALGSRTAWTVTHRAGASYRVDPAAGTCTCPDHFRRARKCKHLHLVGLHMAADQEASTPAPAPAPAPPRQQQREPLTPERRAEILRNRARDFDED